MSGPAAGSHDLGSEPPNRPPSEPPSSEPGADDKNSTLSAYECNICLETASEPVVTLCGHLYW